MESRSAVESFKSAAGNLPRLDQNPVAETLANRLRQARLRKSWTQQELAIRASTSQAVIQKIENGKSLRPRNIVTIGKALEVDPSWLMFGVSETGPLSPEAIALAKAWSGLSEPERSSVRYAVMLLSNRFKGRHDVETSVKRVNGANLG